MARLRVVKPRKPVTLDEGDENAVIKKGMMMRATTVSVVGFLAFIVFGMYLAPKTVHQVASIKLPGNGSYVDYLTVDSIGGKLYAAYTIENAVVVIDTQANRITSSIEGLKDVRGVALVPELGLGFTSNRGEDTIGVIDLNSNRLMGKIANGHGPDAIIYDHAAAVVYAGNHDGRSATLVDPATQKVLAVVPLGGTAEYPQADPANGLVYQNLEDKNEVAVVDPGKRAVVARYTTEPGTGPTGLALDSTNHRLFSACGNEKLVVLDSTNGKVVAAVPIGSGVDFVAYDQELRRIYTANGGSGTMTVISQDAPDRYSVIETVTTAKGAHALAVDQATHRVYVVSGNRITVYETAKEPVKERKRMALPNFLHIFSAIG
jgi:DNA-binding beta-propeller fold protein YncE